MSNKHLGSMFDAAEFVKPMSDDWKAKAITEFFGARTLRVDNHDDALVEAVADAIQYSDGYRSEASRVARELYLGNARAAIRAVRAYDAGLPCGHCAPGDDEIRCACEIGGEE